MAAVSTASTRRSVLQLFNRKPLAPASTALMTASSSAKPVSITTLISGCSERIRRHASMPVPSGSRTSMRITSGCVAAASETASCTLPVSPTTATFRALPNSVTNPRRTTGWSSTMRSRMGSSVPVGLLSRTVFRQTDPALDVPCRCWAVHELPAGCRHFSQTSRAAENLGDGDGIRCNGSRADRQLIERRLQDVGSVLRAVHECLVEACGYARIDARGAR